VTNFLDTFLPQIIDDASHFDREFDNNRCDELLGDIPSEGSKSIRMHAPLVTYASLLIAAVILSTATAPHGQVNVYVSSSRGKKEWFVIDSMSYM
jgi:hypothetical protein